MHHRPPTTYHTASSPRAQGGTSMQRNSCTARTSSDQECRAGYVVRAPACSYRTVRTLSPFSAPVGCAPEARASSPPFLRAKDTTPTPRLRLFPSPCATQTPLHRRTGAQTKSAEFEGSAFSPEKKIEETLERRELPERVETRRASPPPSSSRLLLPPRIDTGTQVHKSKELEGSCARPKPQNKKDPKGVDTKGKKPEKKTESEKKSGM
ncbi:hypothetical protein B0H13DRAFT_1970261 [Mycena leptocephala]|nr:hypothetical protein B0H13DRAFT_1970261 [Mycena leptocephala]